MLSTRDAVIYNPPVVSLSLALCGDDLNAHPVRKDRCSFLTAQKDVFKTPLSCFPWISTELLSPKWGALEHSALVVALP